MRDVLRNAANELDAPGGDPERKARAASRKGAKAQSDRANQELNVKNQFFPGPAVNR